MRYFWLYILGLTIGVVIACSYYVYVNGSKLPAVTTKPSVAPTETGTYSIEEAPAKSLKGSIASQSGSFLFESRTATRAGELKDIKTVQQGERFITGSSSTATLVFEKVDSVELSENTDISFIQTLPTNFVVEQKNGRAKYTVTGVIPVSIRIRSAVITKNCSGSLQIEMTDGDSIVLISTISGDAKIGFNDLDYVSQVFTLRSGEVYEYNSDERTTINIKNK